MDVYKIYVSTRKKDGTIIKSDSFVSRSANKEEAINDATKYAKNYGLKGKIHIGSIFKRDENKVYHKID